MYICNPELSGNAGVVELVDTPDLGSGAARCGSSSLPARTSSSNFTAFFISHFIQTHFSFFLFANLEVC